MHNAPAGIAAERGAPKLAAAADAVAWACHLERLAGDRVALSREKPSTLTKVDMKVPQTLAERDRAAVGAALRERAYRAGSLSRIITVHDGNRLDIVFAVREPLSKAEDEVIPLFRQLMGAPQRLELDFVVVPEGLAEDFTGQSGARIVYAEESRAPGQGEA